MFHRPTRLLPPLLTSLGFALALASTPVSALAPAKLPAKQLAELKAQQPMRIQQGQARLLELRSQWNLGAEAGFTARDPFTNEQGRAVARFRQTHQGLRVWGAEAITHVEVDGTVKALAGTVQPGVALSGGPTLTAAQAQAIALADLAPLESIDRTPVVEAVVFPVSQMSGLVFGTDATGRMSLNARHSVATPRPAGPYVWAYEVKTHLANLQDGFQEMCYIVDGTTGGILRKWNDLRADRPVAATGQSQYSGQVSFMATQTTAGNYLMIDSTRGSQPYPAGSWDSLNFTGMPVQGLSIRFPGWQENANYPGNPKWWTPVFMPYGWTTGNVTNAWGDGQNFKFAPLDGVYGNISFITDLPGDPSFKGVAGVASLTAETGAVDAMHGMASAWDLYQNVFGRDGIDNKGSSTFGLVHPFWFANNAYWSTTDFAMFFGDGTYPANPGAFKDLTEIDVTGHEMGHGIVAFTADLIYGSTGESAGLNEGSADVFGKLTQAYGLRQDPVDPHIPAFAPGDLLPWQVGRLLAVGTPLRYMYKPSLDGVSPDMWYDGIAAMDPHYVMGPSGRMFYFLCQGAPTDVAAVDYSPYLPQGMSGIGIDAGGHIWYKALSEYFPADATYPDARQGCLQAAVDLYGVGSTEVAAVMNAFAAINVGAAAGQPEPIHVTFPLLDRAPKDWTRYPMVPKETEIQLHAVVLNSANQAVTWSFDASPSDSWVANSPGILRADGLWTTPQSVSWFNVVLEAHSQEDPLRFGRNYALVLNLDADEDLEQDALDMAVVAMEWHLYPYNEPFHLARIFTFPYVTDYDIAGFNEAFLNAWGVNPLP